MSKIMKEIIEVHFDNPKQYEEEQKTYVNKGFMLLKRKTVFKITGVYATFVRNRRSL